VQALGALCSAAAFGVEELVRAARNHGDASVDAVVFIGIFLLAVAGVLGFAAAVSIRR
jgi:hypothetical protein